MWELAPPNFQIWNGYCGILRLVDALATDVDVWPSLLHNKLVRAQALRRRFSGPMVIEEASWIATDATPRIIGAVHWRDIAYIRVGAQEIMKEYVEADGLQSGIAAKELTGLTIGSAAGYAARPLAVLLIGAGNLDAV